MSTYSQEVTKASDLLEESLKQIIATSSNKDDTIHFMDCLSDYVEAKIDERLHYLRR